MDSSAITSAVQGFEAAGNIAKGLVGLVRDTKALGQINELQRTIYNANRDALAA